MQAPPSFADDAMCTVRLEWAHGVRPSCTMPARNVSAVDAVSTEAIGKSRLERSGVKTEAEEEVVVQAAFDAVREALETAHGIPRPHEGFGEGETKVAAPAAIAGDASEATAVVAREGGAVLTPAKTGGGAPATPTSEQRL